MGTRVTSEAVVITADTEKLTQLSTQQLAPDPSVDCTRPVILDLRSILFIEPFGLVFLFWLICDLYQRGAPAIKVLAPHSTDVQNYLVRMHLPRAMYDHRPFRDRPLIFEPNLMPRSVRERDLRGHLLELSFFRLQHDDEVHQRTGEILETVLTRDRDLTIVQELRLGVVELLSNVEAHSQTREAVAAVQRYATAPGHRGARIHIAIGDGGIGISAALRDTIGRLADHEMILQALEPHVSSRRGRGGFGLPTLAEAARENGGCLGIRSGRAHVQVGRNNRIDRDCTPVAGTQVEIIWIQP